MQNAKWKMEEEKRGRRAQGGDEVSQRGVDWFPNLAKGLVLAQNSIINAAEAKQLSAP
jgi:hypothetical protein